MRLRQGTLHRRRGCCHLVWAALSLAAVAPGEAAQRGRHYLDAISSAPQAPSGWAPVLGNAHEQELRAAHELSVIVAVRQASADRIVEELERVSDPRSQDYGDYWQLDEHFAAALGARENALLVERWLREEGHASHVAATFAGDFVRARLPVPQAERLFETPLRPFRHRASGSLRFAAVGQRRCSVPARLASAVDFISGLELPRLPKPRPSPAAHLRRHKPSWDSENVGVGSMQVLFTEARDRAFQVHVALLLDSDFIAKTCAGSTDAGCKSLPVSGVEAVCTPVRLGGAMEYLTPVVFNVSLQSKDCQAGLREGAQTQMDCVVVIGPSLGLLNFASTRIKMRAVFMDGSRSDWAVYKGLAYPALSTTVTDMRALYNVPSGFRNRAANNSQAVAAFMNISASLEDAALFRQAMGLRMQPAVQWKGESGEPGVEGHIDLQWIQAMGDNVKTIYRLLPGGYAAHEPFLEWMLALANDSHPALVQSASYGENEEDYALAYERRFNLELAKLGLRGVTVLVATGDTGIQGAAQEGGTPPRCAPFAPVWPASSPFVTAVGGTMISNHVSQVCNIDTVYALGTDSAMPFACPEGNIGEIVCTVDRGAMITGGGGFSDRFERPAWQEKAVQDYFAQAGPLLNRSLFNASGRAYPDISAVGQNVPVFFQGRLVMAGGTSSSSPIAAGLIALLNGERLIRGLPPLGFLNPWLYSVYEEQPQIVQDVLVGNNSGGNQLLPPEQNRNCPQGLHALPGWDAATGLGTPSFSDMLDHLAQMPPAAAARLRSGSEQAASKRSRGFGRREELRSVAHQLREEEGLHIV